MTYDKNSPAYYMAKGYSAEKARVLAKQFERSQQGRYPGISDEFIRPMWALPRPK